MRWGRPRRKRSQMRYAKTLKRPAHEAPVMDGPEFRERLEAAKATELDRLGSNKLLVALTDAELSRERVLRVAADSEHAARETFRLWTDSEDDPETREAFSAVADQEDRHRERVLDALEEPYDPADGGLLHTYLRDREDTIERIATGMVARPLVSRRTHRQVIAFFVNEAEESTADLFRDLRAETDAVIDDGLPLLEDRCSSEEDWERARMVAEYTVQIAYDEYADSLESMGVDPKPVC